MSCPDCYSGYAHEGAPRGRVVKLHGLDTYVSEPENGNAVKGIVVILPDAFGWEFVNNRILADHYADKGDFRVYLPELMNGHAAPVWILDVMRVVLGEGASFFSKLYNIPWFIYGFAGFLFYTRPSKSYPRVKAWFEALVSGEPDLPVGAAGFCWGGKHTLLLAGEETTVGGRPLIDAGFTGHPSLLQLPEDAANMRRPVSFALAEKDGTLQPDKVRLIQSAVDAQPEEVRGEVVIYRNCGHGFCIRADVTKGDIAKQAADAEDQCVGWFKKKFGERAGLGGAAN